MKKLLYAMASLIYINLLPYVSRLPRGLDWAGQYVPDEAAGLLFFHFFYSIPAAVLILSIHTSKKTAIPFLATLLSVTIATIFFHHGYDLASDAQAAIGLIFMPIFVSVLGLIALAAGHGLQYVVDRMASRTAHTNR